MRLVYFGTSEFAVPALLALKEHVLLVVTQPDKPVGRRRELRPSPVKVAAQLQGLEVATPERARNPEFIEAIQALKPDALVVASYGQILSEHLLGCAARGGINLHASVLPKYRGAAPIQRAILQGESETAVTLMQMDKGMDTGDIISIEKLAIDADETAGELESRLAQLGAQMAAEWLPKICAGEYPRAPQEPSAATYAPKIERVDGYLDFEAEAVEAYNRFRATTPRPGAYLKTAFGEIKVLEARLSSDSSTPGHVVGIEGESLTVSFRNGALAIARVQPGGKKPMTAREFANGHRLRAGSSLL